MSDRRGRGRREGEEGERERKEREKKERKGEREFGKEIEKKRGGRMIKENMFSKRPIRFFSSSHFMMSKLGAQNPD